MSEQKETLTINWNKLNSFTAIPVDISSICKYKGKKFSTDHKLIYSYLSKLDYDGHLNSTSKKGLQSFEAMMQRFGIGSKGSLSGYIQHLIDVGLLEKIDNGNGNANGYIVKPIIIDLISSRSKSHTSDSNKNKQELSPTKPKVNNFMVTKKWRNTFEGDPILLKEFNRWMYQNDNDNIEIKDHDVREWKLSQQNPEPSTKEVLKSKLNPNVCDDYGADKGLGWFCNHLLNNSPSKVEVVDYLSIINKRGWWEDFSPTQEQAEELLDKINEKYDPIEDFNPFPDDDDIDSLPF